jgi:hypothetical protein
MHIVPSHLCDELDNSSSLLDLLLGLGGDVAGADNDGDVGQAALAEDLGVAVVEEFRTGALSPFLARYSSRLSAGMSDQSLSRLMVGFQKPFCILWK